jgi:hypothetical protein
MPVILPTLGSRDQDDCGSRPAMADSSGDPFSKIPNTKRADGVTQVAEQMPSKCEALSPNPSTAKTHTHTNTHTHTHTTYINM